MTAAGPVACGGEISDEQSIILRGKNLVCKVSGQGLMTGELSRGIIYLRSALIVKGSRLYSVVLE